MSIAQRVTPLPLRLGQALLFSLPLVHGCEINAEKMTRWSSDQRLMPTFAPIDMGTRQVQYTRVNESPIALCARRYQEANGQHREV